MAASELPPDLFGLVAVVLLLGLKHGFDPDHLATIDGLTRAGSVRHPIAARACGLVVITVALAVVHAAASWQTPGWLEVFGSWVSIAFLLLLGAANIATVLRTPRHDHVALQGLRYRVLRIVLRGDPGASLGHPLWALPVGALFALSFDTVSQAAMFSAATTRSGAWYEAAVCAVAFTLGMIVADGANGLWIARLLRRSDSTARMASRVMGLGIGVASLCVAALGMARLVSVHADRWLAGRQALCSVALIVFVGGSFVIALSLSAANMRRRKNMPGQEEVQAQI
jgi:high-affinity nickel-transport protein